MDAHVHGTALGLCGVGTGRVCWRPGSFPSASGELWQDFLLSRHAEAMGEACDVVCACVLCSVLLLLPHTQVHDPHMCLT